MGAPHRTPGQRAGAQLFILTNAGGQRGIAGGSEVHTRPTASEPVSLGILDHVDRSIGDITTAVRRLVPDAAPSPATAAIYDWAEETTRHLGPARRRALDVLMYKQELEHTVRNGDGAAIRRLPCPACGCWLLYWRPSQHLAVCLVEDCTTNGKPSVWTLGQLANATLTNRAVRRAT